MGGLFVTDDSLCEFENYFMETLSVCCTQKRTFRSPEKQQDDEPLSAEAV